MASTERDSSDEVELMKKGLSSQSMILVMGVTGAGKSSFVNQLPLLSDKRAKVGHTQGSCTSTCETFLCRIGGQDVLVVDTPGFDDDHEGVTDADTLNQIATLLAKQHDSKMQLKGIIYLQRISDNRIGASGRRALQIFRSICGDAALHNVILTTTRWGENPDHRDEERESFLQENVWDSLLSLRARQQRYHGTPDSALGIVQDLLAGSRVVLDIQKQIVEGKKLRETSAGMLVSDNLEELRVQLRKSREENEHLRRQLSHGDEAGRIRADRRQASEQERLNQAEAAEKVLEERVREKVRAEIEEEIRAQNEAEREKMRAELEEEIRAENSESSRAKGARTKKFKAAAKVIVPIVHVVAALVAVLFGIDPGLADVIEGWF